MPRAIETIAVLGAGTMGHGIAYVSARGGFRTRVHDVSEAALASGRAAIAAIVEREVDRDRLDPREAADLTARLAWTKDLADAVTGADCVIEAVPEQMPLKLATWASVDRLAPAGAVFATNTSGLSISEMAAALSTPSRLVGMHFFNPVPRMRLVEIVRTLDTSDEALEKVAGLAHAMGKETIVVRESPGFVTSRVNALIGNEAFYMLAEGIATARDIDTALKLGLNHPMGPFELVDLVGLDTRLAVLRHLHERLGEKYRPCPLLVEYVEAGRLGRKVGKGVYEY